MTEAKDAKEDVPTIAARVSTINEAVQISLKDRTIRKSLFTLARALKAFEITTRHFLSPEDLAGALTLWWAMVTPKLRAGADFDECRFDFRKAFARARTPYGANPLEEAIRRADTAPLPPEASRYKSLKLRRLVAVCSHLQEMAGDSPFFLSTRGAAKALGIKSPFQASDMLSGLVDDGILKVTEQGKPGGKRATRYRFLASGANPAAPAA